MILPMVASLCEDALSAVPDPLRQGGFALGATRQEVATHVVVPSALSGVMASYVLALSRAIGETMAVTLAAGATPRLTGNSFESIQTMTARYKGRPTPGRSRSASNIPGACAKPMVRRSSPQSAVPSNN